MVLQMGYGGVVSLQRLQGGGNNRVYRVDADNQCFLLKVYFHHSDDKRNRLETEFAFSKVCLGVRLASFTTTDHVRPHPPHGLYEFIHGRRLLPHEVTADAVKPGAAVLPGTKQTQAPSCCSRSTGCLEACLAVDDHLRLRSTTNSPTDGDTRKFAC